MSTYRNTFPISVFVSTAEVVADDTKPLDIGAWFDLTDFEGKLDFIVAATLAMGELTGKKELVLHFSDIDAPFDTKHIFSSSDISEQVWHLMDMEDHDHELLCSYIDCFGKDGKETVLESLANAKKAFIGYYDDAYEAVEDYLEKGEVDDKIISTIMPHIDTEALLAVLMADMKVYNNHYFKL